jgi:hypothetical protein
MRSWEFSAFSVGLFSNPLLIGAKVIELAWIWMLLYVEPVQNIFNTATVQLADLWILLSFPILLFSVMNSISGGRENSLIWPKG